MIDKRIKLLRGKFKSYGIDGYVIPKNDEFFSEYSQKDRLKIISNFSGSAGYAIILKKKSYLFVDGRYTLQAKMESGKKFKIVDLKKIINCKIVKNLTLGIDPKVFTSVQIKKFFSRNNKIKEINSNLIDLIFDKYSFNSKPFFSLDEKIVGESHLVKLKKISSFMKKNRLNYLFVSAPENVAWLLNIRGFDNPNSPIPNCRIFINNNNNFFLISNPKKLKKLISDKKIIKNQIIDSKKFEEIIKRFKKGKILIDNKSCSLFYESLFRRNFQIIKKEDPIYFFKSVKTKEEISHMVDAHIKDGVALTKFLYWIKNKNKKTITEIDAQNKLENFRKKNSSYLFPSFDTIAGAGKNGAIIHYKANKKTNKKIKKNDIFLCDSGGQYKYGTTDVTRTICFSKPKNKIKNIFTKVLKGHIAVATANINKFISGNQIDILARKSLKKSGLNYNHGTGHGVGFFSNVHEGPQAISKFNKVKICEGMILSNEPGYYEEGKFGMRLENLVYVKKNNAKLFFENLTLVPIEKDLIDFKILTTKEKNYLFKYHLMVFSKLYKYLDYDEKRWLANFI